MGDQLQDEPPVEEPQAQEPSPPDSEIAPDLPESSDQSAVEPEPPPSTESDPVEVLDYDNAELNEIVERALKAISPDQPCGASDTECLSVISQISTASSEIADVIHREFSEEVRDGGDLGAFELSRAGSAADGLIEQAIDCFGSEGKSMILATYLPRLLMIAHGISGFAAGLDIVRELARRFPSDVFPKNHEEIKNYLSKGVYVGNDDNITDNFKLFLYEPVSDGKSSRVKLPYALIRNAILKGSGPEIKGKYASSASDTSPEFYVELVSSLERAIDSGEKANQALREFLGDKMIEIVSYTFIDSLKRMMEIVHNLADENCDGYPPVEAVEGGAEAGNNAAVANAPQAAVVGAITSRDQAVDLLRKIAEFFEKTERHSPVSYSLRQTVRWSKMDLPSLLAELLNGEEQPLSELAKRVGFRTDSDGNSSSNEETSEEDS